MYKVWKFGGTSVGKFETLAQIVTKIRDESATGEHAVVVTDGHEILGFGESEWAGEKQSTQGGRY